MFYRKGERYKGEWKKDARDGPGILWSSNNTKYVGTFKNDKKSGQGKIYFADGSIFDEKWNNGILVEHVKIHDPTIKEEKKT